MREFDEVAVFPKLRRASVGFAFDVSEFRGKDAAGKRVAFRLLELSNKLQAEAEDAESPEAAARTVHGQLIEPVRSFLDDVTNGAPGVNGRPLLVLAAAPEKLPQDWVEGEDEAEDDDEQEVENGPVVTLVRRTWDYEFEGDQTWLTVRGPERIELLVRDSFCVFESGRIYYVMNLVQPRKKHQLDEYAVIQLQQLGMEPERADDKKYLAFDWKDEERSLIGFVNKRLEDLCDAKHPASAVNKLLRAYGLLEDDGAPLVVGKDDVMSMCVGIEDERVQRTADYVHRLLDATLVEKREEEGKPLPKKHDKIDLAESDWHKLRDATWPNSRPGHFNNKLAYGAISDRTQLAVAGLATGVPDFPFQDESEVHDSTRSTSRSVESALFTHPRFLLEVARNWRSFKVALNNLGNCPYLYLTWMVTVHDEMTVAAMERKLEIVIYDPYDQRHKLAERKRWRSNPLADVTRLLESASNPLGQKTRVLEHNLGQRLEIFRWESIHRCGNMFRYPKETAALDAVRKAMGTTRRFDEVHATLDRLESLVEDASTLASAYAERATNRLLLFIALFALIALPKDLNELGGMWTLDSTKLTFAITAVATTALTAAFFVPWLSNVVRRWWRSWSRRR